MGQSLIVKLMNNKNYIMIDKKLLQKLNIARKITKED